MAELSPNLTTDFRGLTRSAMGSLMGTSTNHEVVCLMQTEHQTVHSDKTHLFLREKGIWEALAAFPVCTNLLVALAGLSG